MTRKTQAGCSCEEFCRTPDPQQGAFGYCPLPGIAAPHMRGRFEMGIGGSVEQSMAPEPAEAEASRLHAAPRSDARRSAAFRPLEWGSEEALNSP